MVPLILDMKNWQGGLANFEEETGSDRVGRFARVQRTIDGWQLPSLSASVARFSGTALPEAERIVLTEVNLEPEGDAHLRLDLSAWREVSAEHVAASANDDADFVVRVLERA